MTLIAKDEMNQGDGTIYLKLYSQKNDEYDPYFLVNNGDDKGKEIGEIHGNFLGIAFEEYEYEDKGKTHTAESIKIDLMDDEKYQLQMGWSALSRGLLNALVSEQPEHLRIRVYVNKAGYASTYIENNGKRMGWKHQMDELMKLTKQVTVEGRDITDWSEVKKKLKEEALKLNDNVSPPITQSTNTQQTPTKKVEEASDEDLPF